MEKLVIDAVLKMCSAKDPRVNCDGHKEAPKAPAKLAESPVGKSTAMPVVDDENFKKTVPTIHSKSEADYKKAIDNLKLAAVLDARQGSGEKQHQALKLARAQFLLARASLVGERYAYAEAKGADERAADGFIADGKREMASFVTQDRPSEEKRVALLVADKGAKLSHPVLTSSTQVEVVQPKATGFGLVKGLPNLVQAAKAQMGGQVNEYAANVAAVEALACMNRKAFGKTIDVLKADAEVTIPSTQEMNMAVARLLPVSGKLNYSTARPLAAICPSDTPKSGSVRIARRD